MGGHLRFDTVLVLIGLAINIMVIISYFTTLENRLTKIETTIAIKLADKHEYKMTPHYSEKQTSKIWK